MFQRVNTTHNYDNRRSFITHNNYLTFQRKGNQELAVQLLDTILQNQINNITLGSGATPDEPDIGTM